ncbi:MAG: ASCH domain-containing protein [Sphaerochaeta sp.]
MTAKEMWHMFTKKSGIKTALYDAWSFGEDADNLARLVLEGKKTATSSVYDLYEYDSDEIPRAGEYSVILDGNDNAICVILLEEVSVVPFKDVDEEQAKREGEGDLSLSFWRNVHEKCFSAWMSEAGMTFNQDTKIVLEKFRLVFKP